MPLIRPLLAGLLLAAASGAPEAIEIRGTTKASGRTIADAAVWLEAPRAPRPASLTSVVLDQRNLSFSPHVLVVQVGTKVEFPNNDRVFHNVFSFRDGKRFDLGLYPVGAVKRIPFDRPGLSRVFCNIHPHMAAYVLVVDSPHFGVSDQSGAFSIRELVRTERLDYNAGAFSEYLRRTTAGARVRVTGGIVAQVNIVGQREPLADGRTSALDVRLTYTIRR